MNIYNTIYSANSCIDHEWFCVQDATDQEYNCVLRVGHCLSRFLYYVTVLSLKCSHNAEACQ